MINNKVVSNVIANQTVHEQYGGVVPELASRAHQKNIIPVVNQALAKANISKTELNAIAFTQGPGLLGALLVGTSFAKSLALGLDIPLIEINHMQAHVLAHFIEEPYPNFPFLCLTVSGGHTQLVLVKSALEMEVIGETLDDAVGEAFDKTAKMLGLPYPGGPQIDKLAQQGNANAFEFPESRMKELNYSFSGIKTAVLYFLRKQVQNNPNFIQENLEDIAASVQKTLLNSLMYKLKEAAQEKNIQEIAIAGGVSANSGLRKALEEEAQKSNWTIHIPKLEYCTDNAAMISQAAYFKYLNQDFSNQKISPMPRMSF